MESQNCNICAELRKTIRDQEQTIAMLRGELENRNQLFLQPNTTMASSIDHEAFSSIPVKPLFFQEKSKAQQSYPAIFQQETREAPFTFPETQTDMRGW